MNDSDSLLVRCYWVEKSDSGDILAAVTRRPAAELRGNVDDGPMIRVRVCWSSLNYKDALAATGHPGIVRTFPHVPGIDAVGRVIDSQDDTFAVGDLVLVTGHDLGVSHPGGWADEIFVPAAWAVPLPGGLSPADSMVLGTAGFTAAQCVMALQTHGVHPGGAPVVVTGATGGVASLAIRLLVQLNYCVVAVTGKREQYESLRAAGIDQVLSREEFLDNTDRPMLSAKYAGAIDTVGGRMLETLLKTLSYRGCVASCGLTGGDQLRTTVYPFLLRGITLAGIDSAKCPMPNRLEIWDRLASDWQIAGLDQLATIVELEEITQWVRRMLAGQVTGRIVVRISDEG